MSANEELYCGTRGNCECIKQNEEYKKILGKCAELSTLLNEGLDERQKSLLFDLTVKQGGLEHESNLAHFAEGLRLRLALAAESLLNK